MSSTSSRAFRSMKNVFMDLKALTIKGIHSYIMGNHLPNDTSSYARRLEISSPKDLQEQRKLPG
jgi:hypothetical protein